MTLRVDVSGASTIGKRQKQEDCFMAYHLIEELSQRARRFNVNVDRDVYMGVLCDGMGGEGNGAWCARQAVQKFADTFAETGSFHTKWLERLYMSLYAANAGIYEYKSVLREEKSNAGCTLVSAVICDELLHFVSVGDSYVWLFQKDANADRYKRIQLNELHSKWVKYEQGEAFVVTDEEVERIRCTCSSDIVIKKQPYAALLGREIGYLDTSPKEGLRLKCGDVVVLASDGVLSGIGDIGLDNLIWDCASPRISADQMAREIIRRIDETGASKQDNASCIVFKIIDDEISENF